MRARWPPPMLPLTPSAPNRCGSSPRIWNKAFYGFEPDFFQQNLLRSVDDVVSVFKGSLELWPTLVEICYLEKRRHGLPLARVENRRRMAA